MILSIFILVFIYIAHILLYLLNSEGIILSYLSNTVDTISLCILSRSSPDNGEELLKSECTVLFSYDINITVSLCVPYEALQITGERLVCQLPATDSTAGVRCEEYRQHIYNTHIKIGAFIPVVCKQKSAYHNSIIGHCAIK